jgi:putative transposase
MPQSLARVVVHVVFSTKNRERFLTNALRGELFPYFATVLTDHDCVPIQIGGVEDHVHLLFGISRTKTIAQIVETLKTSTSKWIKTKSSDFSGFHWQSGYGAFSLSQSDLDHAMKYVANQEAHHAKMSFQDEYRLFLKRYGIAFDERYVWD